MPGTWAVTDIVLGAVTDIVLGAVTDIVLGDICCNRYSARGHGL